MTETVAILGGHPVFTEARHVGMPNLPNRQPLYARLDAILDSRRLSNDGPVLREFEQRVAALTGAKHVIATCNATIAMQLLFRAMGLTGEIIMPSFTFIATAHAAAWEGLKPVFVDVDPDTHTMAPERVRAAITSQTRAIMGVHMWGRCCDVDTLQAAADEISVPLLFDAAHAIGCTFHGRPVGTLGHASVLSFHATKVVQSLEGGAVLTGDASLAAKLRLMRNFGFESYDTVSYLGTNAKLNEVAAAFGICSIEGFKDIVAVNNANLEQYQRGLEDLPGLRFYRHDTSEGNNFQYVIVQIDTDNCPLNRDELAETLHAENILVRKYFAPGCHRMEPHAGAAENRALILPVTERLASELLALPTGTGVSRSDIDLIIKCTRASLEQGPRIREALRTKRSSAH